jgi:hypothetical protein
MRQRSVIIGLTALAAGAVGWYLFRPERLFIDHEVNEAFPGEAAAAGPSGGERVAMASTPDTTMSERMPAAGSAPRTLASGSFHSNAHETTGSATIYELKGGKRVLRLADFRTSNGPDVRVYLVAAADVNDEDTVKKSGFVELGRLKGNVGAQNYEVPAGVDLDKYRSVTIWCKRFSVNFGTAPLSSSES